jgi:RND family efflux transporter MFP subunit
MNHWKSGLLFLAVLIATAAASYFGYLHGWEKGKLSAEPNAATPENEGEHLAKVRVALAVEADMHKLVVAYGTVTAAPEQTVILSVPFEARATSIWVKPGQKVAAGEELVEMAPSPDALLALEEAHTTLDGATRDLANAQSRFDMKLATSQELQTAQQALQLAKGRLAILEKKGIETRRLKAQLDGIVSKVDAQEGQTIAANGPLVELVTQGHVEVRLGIEPGTQSQVKAGQHASVQAVYEGAGPVEGEVRLVTARLNPTSRLVDVFVRVGEEEEILLDSFVKGKVEVASKKALVVPRSAVLPKEGKQVLYTVKDGKTVEHEVKTGWEEDERVEVLPPGEEGKEGAKEAGAAAKGKDEDESAAKPSAAPASQPASAAATKLAEAARPGAKALPPALQAGDLVVIEGNYELEDGMSVEVEKEPAGGDHEVH